MCSFVSPYCSGLLSTPNLIPLPQQNQGSLLSAQTRMGLQTQVGNFNVSVSGNKNLYAAAEAELLFLSRSVRCSEIRAWM